MNINGLQIIDVSNPANPQIVGHLPIKYLRHITFYNDLLFITERRFKILDVSDPANIKFIKELREPQVKPKQILFLEIVNPK